LKGLLNGGHLTGQFALIFLQTRELALHAAPQMLLEGVRIFQKGKGFGDGLGKVSDCFSDFDESMGAIISAQFSLRLKGVQQLWNIMGQLWPELVC
jgi:hypothetical protein